MNEDIIKKRWYYARNELKKLKVEYDKLNKNTQDKLQEIFTSYNITYDKLYKTISPNDKNRLKRKISEWKKKSIYKGYFKYKVEELMKGNVTYKDLIEILIYGAYEEEKEELDFTISTLFSNVALDCYNQGRIDLNKKKKSIIPTYLMSSIGLLMVDGYTWKNYIDAFSLSCSQEILKQYIIMLQQNKDMSAYDKIIERILEKQRNRLICISKNGYSGGLDKYVTAIGNNAYLGSSGEEDIKVVFISDLCEHVTEMCQYMDGMIFNTRSTNEFARPIGDTKKDLVLQNVSVYGLVEGINLPPINQHFHWCHSTISYQTDKNIEELRKSIYKKNDTVFNDNLKEEYDEFLDSIVPQIDIPKELIDACDNVYNSYKENGYENLMIVDINSFEQYGDICTSNSKYNVDFSKTQKKVIDNFDENSLIVIHNHPSNSSFSMADIKMLFENKSIGGIMVTTDKYNYYLKPNDKALSNTRNHIEEFDDFLQDRLANINDCLAEKYENYQINDRHLSYNDFFKEIEWKYGRKEK